MILHAGVSILSRLSLLQHWLASCTALMKHAERRCWQGRRIVGLINAACRPLELFWPAAVLV